MKRLFAALAVVFAVAACSTLEKGSLQDVTLTTPGATDTRCFVRNNRFLYVINPPRRFQVEKSDTAYIVTCLAPGNRRKTVTLPSYYDERSNQNLYNGYVPGAAVDLASGAIFHYPDQVIVDFTGVRPQRMPLPDYQIMMDENPLMRGMEDFRPGVPAVQSDENQVVEPMQKRPPGSMDDTFGTVLAPGEANPPDVRSSGGGASGTAASPATAPHAAATPGVSSPAASNASAASAKSGGMHGLPSWDDMSGAAPKPSNSSGFAGGTASPATAGSGAR